MWTAGWTGTHGVLLLVLIGGIFADVHHESGSGSKDTVPEDASKAGTGSGDGLVCRAQERDWRELEAEHFELPICVETRWGRFERLAPDDADAKSPPPDQDQDQPPSVTVSVSASSSSAAPSSAGQEQEQEQEIDTDSPLDNVNFLSFEEWKKQNLAKAGQSAETVGTRRADEGGKDERRRLSGINNALESLGEDAEIELDFGGFGAGSPEATKPTTWSGGVSDDGLGEGEDGKEVDAAHGVGTGESHRRDAGTTCKERFNYASFDCAATVLKTNPECQGSSSILTENKDSYMLNECRAKNKFLILEMCDDILVDTVVLANYEFFSSIFHTFRVSVADRYPAKPDQWKELGIYEARNTREVQAFAVENPLIWARYLKIELLTHYGSEFYCPLSLVRVHGTTMLEEYKHDGDVARGDAESIAAGWVEIEGSDHAGSMATEKVAAEAEWNETYADGQGVCPNDRTQVENLLGGSCKPTKCAIRAVPVKDGTDSFNPPVQSGPPASNITAFPDEPPPVVYGPELPPKKVNDTQKPPEHTTNMTSSTTATVSETTQRHAITESESRPVTPPKEEQSATPEPTRTSTTQPPAPNPTTQESFFKSVNKRLQMLESNSTLSLLYIEEQSRILRDAFNKVEKRQLAKTSTFLENLNVTVLNELRQFREQYDQVWKSVVFEFEHQRIQYHQETYALSAQLGILADELVFQKRVSVIQSIMVLFCFGLMLFSRGAVSNYIELPSVQNMVSRSYSFRSWSPSGSPGSTRLGSSRQDNRGHRRDLSDDSQDAPSSPTIEYSPPTPTTSSSSDEAGKMDAAGQESLSAPELVRSQSTPPALRRSHGDVDDGMSPSDMTGPLPT